MTRTEYYHIVKAKAREIRAEFGITGAQIRLSQIKEICKKLGIRVEYWQGKLRVVRGVYTCDDGPCIMVSKLLPDEQKIFTIAHELKHHFFDQDVSHPSFPEKAALEISAEIFAVELIFPDAEFLSFTAAMGIVPSGGTARDIILLKNGSQTCLSYGSLAKRMVFHGLATPESVNKVPWIKLAEEVLGEPAHKRIQRLRQAKKAARGSFD